MSEEKRPFRPLVEEICHDLMFEAPERKGETITIDADLVTDHLTRIGAGSSA